MKRDGVSLDVKRVPKTEIDRRALAQLACAATGDDRSLAQDKALREIASGVDGDCHDWTFVAYDRGRLVGWLAFYKISDLNLAQIWDWHPVVLPGEDETRTADALIERAFSHLQEIDVPQVTVDFRVDAVTQARFTQVLGWYAGRGLTELFEEEYYQVEIPESCAALLPEGYCVGQISETDLDLLCDCWINVFSCSQDSFSLRLDAQAKRDFFASSWSREKPLIDPASLALYHGSKLIGFSRVLPLYGPRNGCLAPIGIVPEYRGQGLAQALLRLSMHRLSALGYETMSCFVSTDNLAAIALYKKLGFASRYRICSLLGELP